jgi:ATP phosphoribosyltransferase regulatory subunit
MTDSNRWLLPDGIEEILPPQAWQLEVLHRKLLDLYRSWGYELVIPPFIEYLESLLTGMGSDLDLQTFKITDQLTGRMMGIRADMTPQVARMDAHSLRRKGTTRFCYGGSVLHTRSMNMIASRSPIQVGAELYGCPDLPADIEIISLLLETLNVAGVKDVHLDLGHVNIYRNLVRSANLKAEDEGTLFTLLQSKATVEIDNFIAEKVADQRCANMLGELSGLNGDISVLDRAKKIFEQAPAEVKDALELLTDLARSVNENYPEVSLYFDLSELRGYQYHTGVVYSVYVAGYGQAVAKGGRYDDVGEVFGRARPATGFSADLKALMSLSQFSESVGEAIAAPNVKDSALLETITELRAAGEIVISELSSDSASSIQNLCNRKLVNLNGRWVVSNL